MVEKVLADEKIEALQNIQAVIEKGELDEADDLLRDYAYKFLGLMSAEDWEDDKASAGAFKEGDID